MTTANVVPTPLPAARSPLARALNNPELSCLERRAVTGLVSANADEMENYVAERASEYATGDPESRRRALSRAAAVQEAQVQEIAALLASAIARRDPAVPMLDRVLTAATNRYRCLMDQLRIESAPNRRLTVLAKGTVAITAEAAP
jgi:hypothetical protein